MPWNTKEKQRAYHREYYKRYYRTKRGYAILKAIQQKYYMSPHGKAKRLAYAKTERYKKSKQRYYYSAKGRANYIRGQNKYRKTPHGKFMLARKMALYKGREWTISEVDYGILVAKTCNYCAGQLNPTGIGLDRLDNARGYHLSNVVPCCNICNRVRGNWWTPQELKVAVNAVAFYRKNTNNFLSSSSGSNQAGMYVEKSLSDINR